MNYLLPCSCIYSTWIHHIFSTWLETISSISCTYQDLHNRRSMTLKSSSTRTRYIIKSNWSQDENYADLIFGHLEFMQRVKWFFHTWSAHHINIIVFFNFLRRNHQKSIYRLWYCKPMVVDHMQKYRFSTYIYNKNV